MKGLGKEGGSFFSLSTYEDSPWKEFLGFLGTQFENYCHISCFVHGLLTLNSSDEWQSLISEDEKEQTFLSSFILSPTHMSHSYFSLFLSPNVLHSSIFSPLQSYGKVQTVGLENYTRYSRRVILTTHKMMFWEGKPIVRFLVNILDWHRIWGCLALVYIPSLYILSPLFAFIRAYNHGKHCNYLS